MVDQNLGGVLSVLDIANKIDSFLVTANIP
jgi:hypothetical protein